MRMPPNGRSASTRFQSMARPRAVRARGLEQRVDEVDPGLDRHRKARLEVAGQPQVRMPRRLVPRAASRRSREPRGVVHHEAEQVADAVREKDRGQSRLDGRLRRARHDAVGHEDPGDRTVRLEMDVAVVHAWLHAAHELLLRRVHRPDEVQELARLGGVGPRDVAGIAGVLRACVDQERLHARRALPVQYLVVQDRGVPVETDDVVVRQFLLPRAGCPAIGEVDFVLRGARPEGFFRRAVGTHAGDRRERHALDFVGRLDRPGEVQGSRDARGIVVPQAFGGGSGFSQDGPATLADRLPQFGR